MSKAELSWVPIRYGSQYCSPACGGGCTWAAYQQAQKRAQKLAKRLGPTWQGNVWENLGWHYGAVHSSEQLNVAPSYPSTHNIYTAFLANGRYYGKGCTPRAAVKAAIAEGTEELLYLTKLISAVSNSLTPGRERQRGQSTSHSLNQREIHK